MNKEQLKEVVGELNLVDTVFESDGVSYIDTAVSVMQVYDLIDQLDEPEKVVIPQFVADWWERDGDSVTMHGGKCVEKRHKFSLISVYSDWGLDDHLSKVEVWIDENKSTFLDLVNGKPYEGEKEKLYYVLDKQCKTLLGLVNGKVSLWGGYELHDGNKRIHQLTEKQIKDYDERYWSFAVEVAE